MSLKELEHRIADLEKKSLELEQVVGSIMHRNVKVEADKAWETSWLRRALIAILTYIVIWLYLIFVVRLPNPFINALVPTLGFLLSTLSVEKVKDLWVKRYRR